MKIKLIALNLLCVAAFTCAGVKINYGLSTHQNKRPYQEDRFAYASVDFSKGYNFFYAPRTHYQGKFFGIYDGHAGDKVSSYLQSNLHKQLRGRTSLENAFRYAFSAVEKYALENCDDGSTAVAAFINKSNWLCFAWTGDSRAVLEKNGAVEFATCDHKPDRKDEKERIERAGGKIMMHGVWRVNGLAVSRSVGDAICKQQGIGQIIAKPEYVTRTLNPENHFMVMASDGLWDVMSNEQAVALVNKALQNGKSLNTIAQMLQDGAIKQGSGDNITVCVIQFDWQVPRESLLKRLWNWMNGK
ncbi:MAG TPA: PP2C family protein-serine/threonine phosphatase [Candidatus Babeliales bacterium]|nr:PP2C family protein-serine/threonine phosphatase [Candidatus Babeliales bacterium]